MLISPSIVVNSTPGLSITTGIQNFTYQQLLNTIGPFVYKVNKLYYYASSLSQFNNPVQYLIYDVDGNQQTQVILTPISTTQYQPSMILLVADKFVYISQQTGFSFNLLASEYVQLFFYCKRKRNEDVFDNMGLVNNYREVEKAFGYKVFKDVDENDMEGPAITLFVQNNTTGVIPVNLLNTGSLPMIANALTSYSWNVTGQSFLPLTFSIQVQYPGGPFSTYTGSLAAATPQALVNALNGLGVGVFWLETILGNTYVVTYNDSIAYGNLNVSAGATISIATNISAPGNALDFTLTGGGVISGIIDYGDGNTAVFSQASPINFNHVYAAAGNYTTSVYLNSPNVITSLQAIVASEISAITGLGNLSNLTTLLVQNQQITGIDITGNPLLINVVLSTNFINTIDVSANIALTTLGLANNNLSSVDVSTNILLQTLNISNNQLSAIDISNNPQLQIVLIQNNLLPVADINASLVDLAGFAVNNGNYNSSGQVPPAAPTGAGAAAKATLIAGPRLWTVTTD